MSSKSETLEFANGVVQIDAAVVAAGLGIAPSLLLRGMREGAITGRCEQGVDADAGRRRLTFYSKHRRLRLIVDECGAVIQRSSLDFGENPLPKAAHRLGP